MMKIDRIEYDNGRGSVTLDVFYDAEFEDIKVAQKIPVC